eukprot:2568218-Rhodomonas_salina.1
MQGNKHQFVSAGVRPVVPLASPVPGKKEHARVPYATAHHDVSGHIVRPGSVSPVCQLPYLPRKTSALKLPSAQPFPGSPRPQFGNLGQEQHLPRPSAPPLQERPPPRNPRGRQLILVNKVEAKEMWGNAAELRAKIAESNKKILSLEKHIREQKKGPENQYRDDFQKMQAAEKRVKEQATAKIVTNLARLLNEESSLNVEFEKLNNNQPPFVKARSIHLLHTALAQIKGTDPVEK